MTGLVGGARKAAAALGGLFFGVVMAGGQSPDEAAARLAKERRDLLDFAVGLSVEYRADITLRLLGESGARQRLSKAERELLDDIFQQAPQAKYAVAMRSIGEFSDTRSARLGRASALRLDALSIQARLVLLVLRQAPQVARDWMARIRLPETPPAACRDALIADPAIYFETLGRVFREAFSTAARTRGEDMRFLEDCLRKTTTLAQMVPALKLVLHLPVAARERAGLVAGLAAKLESLPITPREFSYFEADLSLSKLIQEVALLQQAAGRSPIPLLRWYRETIRRNLTEEMCADGLFSSAEPDRRVATTGSAKRTVSFFNESLVPLGAGAVEALPARFEGIARGEGIAVQPLRAPTDVLPVLRLLRNAGQTEEWRPALARFLTTFRDPAWREGNCKPCVFYERAGPLKVLIDMVPLGPERLAVVDEFLDLLADSPLYLESPIEWLHELQVLVGFSRAIAADDRTKLEELRKEGFEIAMLPRGQEDDILARMAASRNPAIAAYAKLERICPQPLGLSPRLPPARPPR